MDAVSEGGMSNGTLCNSMQRSLQLTTDRKKNLAVREVRVDEPWLNLMGVSPRPLQANLTCAQASQHSKGRGSRIKCGFEGENDRSVWAAPP